MFKALENQDKRANINPVYVMADSRSARFETADPPAFRGMRGLMAKPSGEVIETPITSTSAKALPCCSTSSRRTARARAWPIRRSRPPIPATLTRRLVDGRAQDVIINERDCGTTDGIYVEPIIEAGVEVGAAPATASWAAFPSTRSRTFEGTRHRRRQPGNHRKELAQPGAGRGY